MSCADGGNSSADGDVSGTGGSGDGDADTDTDTDTDADTDTDGNTDADTVADTDADTPVAGLDISRIALYQGTEIPLMESWAGASSDWAKVVQGKDALVRVFVQTQPEWSPREVEARLEINSSGVPEGAVYSSSDTVSSSSSAGSLASTFNFTLPGEAITGDLQYSVSLFETSGTGDGDADHARWPESGVADVTAESCGGTLDLVIVPVQYDADGSGRLPDTSAAHLGAIRDHFYTNYPVPFDDINIRVTEPMSWNQEVLPNGVGWDYLLDVMTYFKQDDGGANNEYYYGLFLPDDSEDDYCADGCIAGMGWVSWTPSDGWSRIAIGLGFPESSAQTMIHEVGHNHGREHAPCGDVDGVDSSYPYSDGSIGVWGYDLLNGTLKDPEVSTDFMGYCDDQWVSDYTYGALLDWIQSTNALPYKKTLASPWQSVRITASGEAIPGGVLELDTPPGGALVDVILYTYDMAVLDTVTGYFTPYSSLPGGVVLFPQPSEDIVYVSVDGSPPAPISS